MKKLNRKQIAWSRNQVSNAKKLASVRFFVGLCLLVVGLLALAFVFGDITPETFTIGTGGVSYAMSMALIGDLPQISDRYSAANQAGQKVWLVALEQIDGTVAFPEPNASREVASITLKDGEYMHYFDLVETYPRDVSTGEKAEFNTTFNNEVMLAIRGNRAKSLDFLEEYSGMPFILIYEDCESAVKYIRGSYCKPLYLRNFNRKNDNEGRYITFTLGNDHWRQPLLYVGTIIDQSPVSVSAGATSLAITSNNRYRLSDHTSEVTIATVSGIGSADYGRVIDILAPATGDNPPAIADGNVFILVDGTTWTANPGSKISFKILDYATLYEVSGSRIQTA